MKFSVCMNYIIIVIYTSSTTYSQDCRPVPGGSGCVYFGSTQEMCNTDKIAASDLPEECSSLLFYDLRANSDFEISDGTKISGNAEYIQDMLDCDKPSFIFFGHHNFGEWTEVLANNSEDCGVNAKTEMENLKCYLEQYKSLSGLVLQKLTIERNTTCLSNFTANLKVYLDEMRNTFPNYSIGIELNGRKVINYYENQSTVEWLDFNCLDSCIDFYILNVYSFNVCNKKFKNGGTTPVCGNAKYTLEKLSNYTTKAGIPKEKTYFLFKTGPKATNHKIKTCELTNTKLCENSSLDGYCADNTQSYYDKGAFTKQNGVGFIASDLDLSDDPLGKCECKSSYPAFYSMLAGFNCDPVPEACPLLDKN